MCCEIKIRFVVMYYKTCNKLWRVVETKLNQSQEVSDISLVGRFFITRCENVDLGYAKIDARLKTHHVADS